MKFKALLTNLLAWVGTKVDLTKVLKFLFQQVKELIKFLKNKKTDDSKKSKTFSVQILVTKKSTSDSTSNEFVINIAKQELQNPCKNKKISNREYLKIWQEN